MHIQYSHVILVSSFKGYQVSLKPLNPPGYGPAIFYASAKVASMQHVFLVNLRTYNTGYHQFTSMISNGEYRHRIHLEAICDKNYGLHSGSVEICRSLRYVAVL